MQREKNSKTGNKQKQMNLIIFQLSIMITLHGKKEKEGGMEGRGKEERKEFIQVTNKHSYLVG